MPRLPTLGFGTTGSIAEVALLGFTAAAFVPGTTALPTLGFAPLGTITNVTLLGFGVIAAGPTAPAADDLCAALADLAHADVGLVAAFGRAAFFWLDAAPPEEPSPLAVLTQDDGQIDLEGPLAASPSWRESGDFTITVYAATRASARMLSRLIAEAIESADTGGTLSYAAGDIEAIYCRKDGRAFDQLDPERGPDGGDVWGRVQRYKVIEEFTAN